MCKIRRVQARSITVPGTYLHTGHCHIGGIKSDFEDLYHINQSMAIDVLNSVHEMEHQGTCLYHIIVEGRPATLRVTNVYFSSTLDTDWLSVKRLALAGYETQVWRDGAALKMRDQHGRLINVAKSESEVDDDYYRLVHEGGINV